MFSSLTELGAAATLEALSRGASDFFAKPGGPGGLEASRQVIRTELIPAIRALCTASKRRRRSARKHQRHPVRPARLHPPPASMCSRLAPRPAAPTPWPRSSLLLPPGLPVPIVVVQHMPPMFTQMLAERLTKNSQIPTVEAKSGSELEPGKAWIAPGDHHLVLVRDGTRIRTKINQEPHENACRPAVDPLFRSVASIYGRNCLAVVLTGMGQDGLRGCEAIRAAGGQILAQDEATSVVWGMPGFVARAGLADKVLPLPMMAGEIVRRVRGGRG